MNQLEASIAEVDKSWPDLVELLRDASEAEDAIVRFLGLSDKYGDRDVIFAASLAIVAVCLGRKEATAKELNP
jgi:hypothetical protein